MRRILLVLTAFLIMAAMLMASALPTLAQGPPTIPPEAQFPGTSLLKLPDK